MENRICELDGLGTCKVGEDWLNYATRGYNRLYYINGGTGWYVKNGEKIPFLQGNFHENFDSTKPQQKMQIQDTPEHL